MSSSAALLSPTTFAALYGHPTIRWAAGGWTFFILENYILSENRTYLIQELGDDKYHAAYGTLSTVATASIGYAYYTIRQAFGGTAASLSSINNVPPKFLTLWSKRPPPIPNVIGAWVCLSVGLTMASQSLPKLQIPFALVQQQINDEVLPSSSSSQQQQHGPQPLPPQKSSPERREGGGYQFQVRCPFDFTDKKMKTLDAGSNSDGALVVSGVERISRHPGLWSLGLVGISQALIVPTLPQRIWWIGPAAVAWIGGSHTDSRFRRNMGGSLAPEYECQTSNIPFWAMICGKQQQGSMSQLLTEELKPLNAGIAIAASSLWILRRVRR